MFEVIVNMKTSGCQKKIVKKKTKVSYCVCFRVDGIDTGWGCKSEIIIQLIEQDAS